MACLTVKRTRDSDPTVWMHQIEGRQDIYRVAWPPEPLGAMEQHAVGDWYLTQHTTGRNMEGK